MYNLTNISILPVIGDSVWGTNIISLSSNLHKYFVIINNKKIQFGAEGYNDYTIYYKKFGKEYADMKKKAYIGRHKVNENFNNPFTAGYYARWILWNKSTVQESFNDVKRKLNISK